MPNLIEFGKDTAASEQEVLKQFDTFVISKCGWSRLDTVSDTTTDRDYVYFSRGKVEGKYRDLYVRLRAYNNYIYVFGYSYWQSSTVYSGQLHNSTYSLIPVSGSSIDWYGFGDEDGFWLVINDAGSWYSLHAGYVDSYYPDDVDTLPLIVVGQIYTTEWYNNVRCYMYGALDDMSTTTSGATRWFGSHTDIYYSMLQYSAPSDRDGTEQGHCPIVIYSSDSYGGYEVRGELRHALFFPGSSLSSGDWYTISGTNYKYFIKNNAVDKTEGFGPIDTASGTSW